LGFSHSIGQELYCGNHNPGDFKITLPPEAFLPYDRHLDIRKGMYMEARHPLFLQLIGVAYVKKVLKHGYFIACFEPVKQCCVFTEFCFHISSPYILPCGFCASNGVEFTVPLGEDSEQFSWPTYLGEKDGFVLDLHSREQVISFLKW